MKKIFKIFILTAVIMTAALSLAACDFGGNKETEKQLKDLQGKYDELDGKYKALQNQNTALQESGKTFFEITAPGACTISPPLYFAGSAAGENPYADLSSPTAQYSALGYAAIKTPAFTAGRDVYYRFTCVFMQTGMYALTFGFENLKALDMTASIKALFRLYIPSTDGMGGIWQDNSLFLLSSVGDNRTGVMVTMQATAAAVNKGFTFYMGYSISNSGLAPIFTGKAFSADSLAIKVAKTA